MFNFSNMINFTAFKLLRVGAQFGRNCSSSAFSSQKCWAVARGRQMGLFYNAWVSFYGSSFSFSLYTEHEAYTKLYLSALLAKMLSIRPLAIPTIWWESFQTPLSQKPGSRIMASAPGSNPFMKPNFPTRRTADASAGISGIWCSRSRRRRKKGLSITGSTPSWSGGEKSDYIQFMDTYTSLYLLDGCHRSISKGKTRAKLGIWSEDLEWDIFFRFGLF